MANRMIAIALLSLGMVAMNGSTEIWNSVLHSEVLHRAATSPASQLFLISDSGPNIYAAPELGEKSQPVASGKYGMKVHHCTDVLGQNWTLVILKKENGRFFWGWMKSENLSPLPLNEAPPEWEKMVESWGFGEAEMLMN